ncbi:hypothetical protein L226DRAFT_616573 [Lentinus tigrinus ALCF2SS1-7]|uniref:F-box domain-containing protein n=1 Tax=Lentinus tigrinus ALCF2SS1-6 TaxID=1328759 RepID=A0A5C2S6C9_9APHY|nr:hypothetical protein L227DRAFT_654558 [Lentinus tigrinus ALCF2SS1-6]RPD69802.1 hypothetical protein L226DRAFT_616573 [Lentinus tigrinus ALCF2SS1-7]
MSYFIRHVNGLSIDALPTETLLHIFSECAVLTEAGWKKDPEKSIYLWTRILRVCRLWRDIALSYPFLWTGILMRESLRISFNTLAQLFLQRSRGKPVRLYVVACRSPQIRHEIDWRLRQLLQQAIPRATEIHVHLMRNTELESFWSTFAAPAKLMSSLRIVCKIDPPPVNQRLPQAHQQLNVDVIPQSGLFLDTTPLLRSVSIHGAPLVDAESKTPKLLLQMLQSIELVDSEDSHYPINQYPTPLHHLRVTATVLTALTIRSFNLLPLPNFSPHVIVFPRLQTLEVSSASSFAAEILRRVGIPQTAGVRIDLFQHASGWMLRERWAAIRRHDGISSALVKLLAASLSIRAISVTPTGVDGDRRVFHSFWTDIPPNTLPCCPEWAPTSLRMTPRLSFANAVQASYPLAHGMAHWCDVLYPDMADLLSLLPLTTCRVLYLHQIPADTASWEGDALLSSATSLHTIEAWGDMAAKALTNLLNPPSEETLTTRLSSLRVISFVGLTMDFQTQVLVPLLATISVRRAAHGLATLDVQFRNCVDARPPQ